MPLKLSALSLEACVDALIYCILAAKRGLSSLWADFPKFATTSLFRHARPAAKW
jgi:hypothetical protein